MTTKQSGRRPDLVVTVRAVDGSSGNMPIAAWWREGARYSGGLDRRVKRVAFLLDDGTRVDIRRGDDGRVSHWMNVYDNQGNAGTTAPPSGSDEGWPGDDDLI